MLRGIPTAHHHPALLGVGVGGGGVLSEGSMASMSLWQLPTGLSPLAGNRAGPGGQGQVLHPLASTALSGSPSSSKSGCTLGDSEEPVLLFKTTGGVWVSPFSLFVVGPWCDHKASGERACVPERFCPAQEAVETWT